MHYRNLFHSPRILYLCCVCLLVPVWVPAANKISVGNSQTLVRALQGNPDQIEYSENSDLQIWHFGASTIQISSKTNKVLGWSNDGNNLQVSDPSLKKATGNTNQEISKVQPTVSNPHDRDDLLRASETIFPSTSDRSSQVPNLQDYREPSSPFAERNSSQGALNSRRFQQGYGVFDAKQSGQSLRQSSSDREGTLLTEHLQRSGGLQTVQSYDVQGNSLTATKNQLGSGIGLEYYQDQDGKIVFGSQIKTGSGTHSSYHDYSSGKVTRQNRTDYGTDSYFSDFENSDGLQINQSQQNAGGNSQYENFHRQESNRRNNQVDIRKSAHQVGADNYQEIVTSGISEDGTHYQDSLLGVSRSSGNGSGTDYFANPATGYSVSGITQNSSNQSISIQQNSDGETVTHSMYRVGDLVFHTYVDSKGNVRTETTVDKGNLQTNKNP